MPAQLLAAAEEFCSGSARDPAVYRDLLVRLWVFLKGASLDQKRAFVATKDKEFNARAAAFEDALIGRGSWPALDPRLAFVDLAAFAYALDRFPSVWLSWGPNIGDVVEVNIGTAEEPQAYWLSMRRQPLRKGDAIVGQKTLPQALYLFHRVMPRCLQNGFEFKVAPFPIRHRERFFPSGKAKALTVVAGVFTDGAQLNVVKRDGRFWVSKLKTRNDLRTREASIKRLFSASLDNADANVIILPEMTLPRDREQHILKAMRKELKSREDDRKLLVLLGSFHAFENKERVNSASLYLVAADAPAVEVLRHNKFAAAFIDKRSEKIALSNSLTLLATPMGLWLVVICMDFCDQLSDTESVWDYVDAELILVPSYGDVSTLSRHVDRAQMLGRRLRYQALVTQQLYHPKAKGRRKPVEPLAPGAVLFREWKGSTRRIDANSALLPGIVTYTIPLTL